MIMNIINMALLEMFACHMITQFDFYLLWLHRISLISKGER